MILHIFLLVVALCMDLFVASIAYGAGRISFSWKQAVAVNGICSLCLGVSLLFGSLIDGWISEKFTKEICFFSLLLLGCLKLADAGIRRYVREHKEINRKIHFSFSRLRFLITIYGDPLEADADRNAMLSWREVFFFSFAMSIDSLIAGTMAAFLKISVLFTVCTAFFMGILFTWFGLFIGRRIGRNDPGDLSWVSGLLFLLLAVLKRS